MKSYERLMEVEENAYPAKFYRMEERNHDWNFGTDSEGGASQKENVVDVHDVILELTSDPSSADSEQRFVGA